MVKKWQGIALLTNYTHRCPLDKLHTSVPYPVYVEYVTDQMSEPDYTAASVEVLVIGGGVIGSSIAYHIARQGRNVLVVERNEIAVEPAAFMIEPAISKNP